VLVSDPEGENALRRLLEIATRKKDEEAQARVLARLAAADPYATRERARFGRILMARQAWEEAVTVLSTAVVIHPRGKEEWDLLSQALEGEKKLDAAIDARQSALSLIEINAVADPERARADELVEIGRLWLKRGDKEKARQAAKRALTESPGHEAAQKLYDEALKE
jgi:tetratricopeptide (TPR) repeat protein